MSLLELIADPVRLQIVRRLAGEGPVSLQELADVAGVHLNTARVHLTALEDGGAVVARPRQRAGRGKQGLEYELAPGWTLGAEDFRAIAEILAGVIAREGVPTERRLELGRAWGRYMLGRPGAHDSDEAVLAALERFGQLAEIDDERVRMLGCPCILVSPRDPELICDLAVGVVDGVLEASGSARRVVERQHHHAERRCRLRLRGPA